MANRNKRGWGLAAVATFVALFIFKENATNFLEETKLNQMWTRVGPIFDLLIATLRFLGNPWMTHLYALMGGIFLSLIGTNLTRSAQIRRDDASKMSLGELVDYLTEESKWAKNRGFITDQQVQFELLDQLSGGRLNAYGRRHTQDGNPSPLTRIDQSYFDQTVIDLSKIRRGERGAIRLKPGWNGDHFEHWQFRSTDVERLWPRPKPPRAGWRKRVLGA